MAEWLKAAVLKTVDASGIRGFESLSLCKVLTLQKNLGILRNAYFYLKTFFLIFTVIFIDKFIDKIY